MGGGTDAAMDEDTHMVEVEVEEEVEVEVEVEEEVEVEVEEEVEEGTAGKLKKDNGANPEKKRKQTALEKEKQAGQTNYHPKLVDGIMDVLFSNGQVSVWNTDVAYTLRRKHRIVGMLAGSIPQQVQQNSYFTLPLLLMEEETTLALDLGIIRLVSKPPMDILHPDVDKESTQRAAKKMRSGEPDAEDNTDKIVCQSTSSMESGTKVDSAEWKFPQKESEKLRYAVYSDLWRQGYYMTAGTKFGADFLIYKGDPISYHSNFLVICLPWDRFLSPLDIVSCGRLGTTVKKGAVFASVDPQGDIQYITVEWENLDINVSLPQRPVVK